MMLEGFPKVVTKTKIKRGHYRLTRDDGYVVEVIAFKPFEWRMRSSGGFKKYHSLKSIIYDMEHGYTAKDQWDAIYGDVMT